MMNTVTIEQAGAHDLEAISTLGVGFGEEGRFSFDPEAWVRLWSAILASAGMAEVLVARRKEDPERRPVGALGILYAPNLFNGEFQAQEAFWFVQPGARGCGMALLEAAEERARVRGARSFIMAHLSGLNERLAKVYERRGYQPLETMYALSL